MVDISIFSCFVKMLGVADVFIGIHNMKSDGQSEAAANKCFENIPFLVMF